MYELSYIEKAQLKRIYSNAIAQCRQIDEARAKCESALGSINCYLQSLSESWQGDGATAAYEKLEELKQQLNSSIEAISALSAEMYAQAEAVNTEWYYLNSAKMTEVVDVEAE